MNSKEDRAIADGESPTNESQRPLLNNEGGDVWSNYEGGVAVVSNEQNDDRNGLHMSETQVGGSPFFRPTFGDQQSFPVNNPPMPPQSRFDQNSGQYETDGGDGVTSLRGREVMNNLKKMEADSIVMEMVTVRNRWGTRLLPNSICNAFVRERIPHTVDRRQFRIDCAQFFEPVPFYGSQQTDNPGELMKMYRFSVYDLTRNEVVLRYYLERSNVTQLYHVLCFTCDNYRGQVIPYGSECPSYWEVRRHMMEDVLVRLKSSNAPNTISLNFSSQQGGPVIIQIP